jgi:PS-10 peptidase S37
MIRVLGLLFAIAVASSGCGDNLEPPGLTPAQLLARLRELPGVTVKEVATQQADFHYYVLHVTQPVDHDDPSQGTFQQQVSLLHRDTGARVPMIIHTSGYSDYTLDRPVELTKLLLANQVSIEHRYFGTSRPVPTDWTKLTIAQAAADEHEIIATLRTLYDGAFLTTGGSKGGMTAVFHRRFYPDDVDGTVAYVTPISFGVPDPRYPWYVDTIGPVDCRQAVRDVAVEMLARRRAAIWDLAESQPEHTYTRVRLGPAIEAAIVALEWTFWQYAGIEDCPTVPPPTASDEVLFKFLDEVSPVSDNDDARVAQFEAYFYQSYAELGFPDGGTEYLAPYLRYTEEDYADELPVPEPVYDSNAMRDIDDFVEHRGDRLLFVYGEWDPWTGGKFALGNATDSALLTQPRGTHWAKIVNLEIADREQAFIKLKDWTGVTPMISRARAMAFDGHPERQARVPPALRRARAARK